MKGAPPEVLLLSFDFLGWQRVLWHCASVNRAWSAAADEYLRANVLQLADNTASLSGWELCNTVYNNAHRPHVVLRSHLHEQEWPLKLLHLALETLALTPTPGEALSSSSSLYVAVETSCLLVDCDALLNRITLLLPRRYAALRLRLPAGLIPAPTFLLFANAVTAYPVYVLSLCLHTTDVQLFLPGWRRLLRYHLANATELTVDCPDMFTSLVVLRALSEVGNVSSAPLYRLCLRFRGKRAFTASMMCPLWAVLRTLREPAAGTTRRRLRELDLAFVDFMWGGCCGLENYLPDDDGGNAHTPVLDSVRLDVSGSGIGVPALCSLLTLLGPTNRLDLCLGDNPLLADLWNAYLPLAATLCWQRLTVRKRGAWRIDAPMAAFMNACRTGGGLVVSLATCH